MAKTRKKSASSKSKKSASTKAGKYVKEEMHAMKRGSKKVKSRKQAIAIGLSRARKAGIKVGKKKASKRKAAKASPRRKMNLKTSSRQSTNRTRESNTNASTNSRARTQASQRQSPRADSFEQQTPLASFDSHVESTREMGVTVAANAPKKEALNEKVKAQNKTAKNVSHTRSHSSQYRG